MLALTPTAAAVVNTLTTASGQPQGAGLRISSEPAPEGMLLIEIASSPADHDRVIAETGARVFLAPDAASYLDDKVLDAKVDDQGEAQFMLRTQGRNGAGP
ncbi:Fe-S cluster assembly protein HesB [Kibdelosporangium aridum]|uniref:Fe-S cluster assembly protein HesB n=1 Tax=Kibdelosporangium aridum TaxID=2030 RepID=A0A428Z3U6_KIBAR|nr:hypothetical protein [Kibdelosporangium aridum]RSM80883.1 Fe-S cluster assembly protein HesB [Kibdelosporangium aridum]